MKGWPIKSLTTFLLLVILSCSIASANAAIFRKAINYIGVEDYLLDGNTLTLLINRTSGYDNRKLFEEMAVPVITSQRIILVKYSLSDLTGGKLKPEVNLFTRFQTNAVLALQLADHGKFLIKRTRGITPFAGEVLRLPECTEAGAFKIEKDTLLKASDSFKFSQSHRYLFSGSAVPLITDVVSGESRSYPSWRETPSLVESMKRQGGVRFWATDDLSYLLASPDLPRLYPLVLLDREGHREEWSFGIDAQGQQIPVLQAQVADGKLWFLAKYSTNGVADNPTKETICRITDKDHRESFEVKADGHPCWDYANHQVMFLPISFLFTIQSRLASGTATLWNYKSNTVTQVDLDPVEVVKQIQKFK